MQSIGITTRPPTKKSMWNQLSQFRRTSTSHTYRKDLSWPYFDNEPGVQEQQQVKVQQSSIFAFVACLTVPSSN